MSAPTPRPGRLERSPVVLRDGQWWLVSGAGLGSRHRPRVHRCAGRLRRGDGRCRPCGRRPPYPAERTSRSRRRGATMNPLLRAEQAVLGSVLLDPGQLSHLDWLAPDHFDRPVHQALFAALRKLRADGHPGLAADTSVPLSWVTDTVEEAYHHVRGLSAVYAHSLVSACPRPEHAPAYGRMVLEGAIHRSVTAHAIRLHQAARADALRAEVEGALHHADVLSGVLDDLARRWGTDPRPVPLATPCGHRSGRSAAGSGRSGRRGRTVPAGRPC